jgi:N-acylneuraminate cytidylyltransferase
MINGMKILCVIPARGGSKGLPGKNIRVVGGKPLIEWTADAAAGSKYIDRSILSSDDQEIIAVGRACGLDVPFIRPARLAGDKVSAQQVALHALEQLPGYDILVLLQPTSPLRLPLDIDICIEACVENNLKSAISVAAPEKSPYWMFTRAKDMRWHPIMGWDYMLKQRQELPTVVCPNGAVYVAGAKFLIDNGSFINPDMVCCEMPRERSLDIHNEHDIRVLETIVDALSEKKPSEQEH